MTRAKFRTADGRRWSIALAALALIMQVLVPQGFMISGGGSGAPSLVICTGHGPLFSPSDHGQPAKAPKSKPDMPCGFAGHGVTTTPPAPLAAAATPVETTPAVVARAFDMAPGLGLAAPPPQSHAPPIV
jgi:hypothetical protein